MSSFKTLLLFVPVSMWCVACGSDDEGSPAAGGAAGNGGGQSGSGGAATGGGGSGGAEGGSGGASGSGGSSAGTGGSSGSGGSGAGGSGGGTGGNAGAGGVVDTGEGCTPAPIDDQGELEGRWGSITTSAAGKEYFLQVNEWNSRAAQRVAYGGDFFFKMTVQEASVPTDGGPTGFPSIFIGANSGNSTSGSNLPIQVSNITALPTSWTWTDEGTLADTTNNSYNVAYDVWFSTNPGGEPEASFPSGGFLMVWLYDPPDAEPIGGSAEYGDVTIEGIPGNWDIWIGPNGNVPVISYVARRPITSMTFDLKRFITDAVDNRPGTIQSGWYLTNVFAGFEIWRGGQGLETTSFCAIVE